MSDSTAAIARLLDIMSALRDPDSGCPWDLQQDFASIAPHTLEEVYEVIDAIEQGNMTHLQAELGDLLFQIVFYARLAQEQGEFDFADIAHGLGRKLLQRHPHVFPDGTLESAGRKPDVSLQAVSVTWEQIKRAERRQKHEGPESMLDDVPHALPALMRATKLQKRAATAGFDWQQRTAVVEKLREEITELEDALDSGDQGKVADEFGDVLFTMVNLSRHLGLNAETVLRSANRKFESRFRAMEALVASENGVLHDMDEVALDACWRRVKAAEN